jgi:nondiscriminating glutamyl-tRNA synthetase
MVVTRFAPSPTGRLHIGGARTALFNFLFARKNNGKFILRIEDTDKERSKKEYEEDIIENLHWLGIEFDEIFRQSERIEIYKEKILELEKNGLVYKCFCTKEELEAQKLEQLSQGIAPRYSGRCLKLTKEEIKNFEKTRSYVYRIKMIPEKIVIKDLIKGEIVFDGILIGDFIIAKSLTEPLFNFATPIDDALMKVTHVIRGEDHISNTPKQIIVLRHLGFSIPQYAHIPMILSPDYSKLSKRHGATSILDFKNEGFLPEAIFNFILLLGWHEQSDKEFYTLKEAIEAFSLERVQTKPAVFNEKKLIWFNRQYMLKKSNSEILKLTYNYFKELYGEQKEELLLKVINLAKERANTLKELVENSFYFFKEPEYPAELLIWNKASKDTIRNFLIKTKEILEKLDEKDFLPEKIKFILTPLSPNDLGLVFWPLRVALTGKEASPSPFDIANVLGKEKTIRRIERAIEKLS